MARSQIWDGVDWLTMTEVAQWDEILGKPDFDTIYLPLTGGTLTGVLNIAAEGITYPNATLGGGSASRIAFRWDYNNDALITAVIDNAHAYPLADRDQVLKLTGGTITGTLTLDLGQTVGHIRFQEWFGGLALYSVDLGQNYIVMGGTDKDNPYLYLDNAGVNINRPLRISWPVTFHNPASVDQKVEGHYTSGNAQSSPWIVISGSAPSGTNVGPGSVWFQLP